MSEESHPLTRAEARTLLDEDLQELLEGGDYPLNTESGISDITDYWLGQVAGALVDGRDPAPAVAQLWTAFDTLFE